MAEILINGSGVQYPMVVNSDGSINTKINGDISIGSVMVDAVTIADTYPDSNIKNNPSWRFEYDGNRIANIYMFGAIGSTTGSYIQSFSYNGSLIESISSWGIVP